MIRIATLFRLSLDVGLPFPARGHEFQAPSDQPGKIAQPRDVTTRLWDPPYPASKAHPSIRD